MSNDYLDLITDFLLPPGSVANENNYDYCYQTVNEIFNVVYVARAGLPPWNVGLYKYQNMPKVYGLMQLEGSDTLPRGFDHISLQESGILQAQRPPLSLKGNGVVMAFIDTGIDYTNPVFLDANGNSRILAIWDQTIQSGTPPEGFLYGSEYSREQIQQALRSENPYEVVPSRDENGHGTDMAGVAAGSSIGNGVVYLGAAPECDIVVVKLKECKPYFRDYYLLPENVPAYAENDIMFGVKYAESFAETFRRPVVICIGLGTNMGDHTGSSPLARYLDSIAIRRSRAVVICGGNEGNTAHHYEGKLAQRLDAQQSYEDVEIRVGENQEGFFLELWGSIPDIFNIAIRSPGGETIPPLRLGVDQETIYSFIYDRTLVTISSVLVEESSGDELLIFRFQQPTAGVWNIRVSSVGEVNNGEFDLWLPISGFMTAETYFLRPSPYTTLTEPSLAEDAITVSTYNDINNSFYIESGRGFSRDGRITPDWAAPGVNISTVRGKQTGSCLAAAITSGGVAQFMQWAVVEGNSPLLESIEVKNYFIRGATRTADLVYPNREWGYGRLNVIGTFDVLAGV